MRVIELFIAKRNEKVLKAMGAEEVGERHYRLMVAMHALFLLSFLLEARYRGGALSPWWPLLFAMFLAVQTLRIWSIVSLGTFWNTKILVLPNANVVVKGPYRFLRHPNYLVVMLEFLLIPLLFQAYVTAIVFSLLNAYVLSVRISMEEKALVAMTNYEHHFHKRPRFLPFLSAK
ncbi:isoprenylcysteine carboxyl methyltransferase family protein [Anoxybacteroides tepidamans]|uniref:isoprenylcysteine carboxyl methyltransferase family protein n=1 Tax=Anoxybacteroides tepidamans TaxID=265948 RepID=UPI0018DB5AE2|nr:isoprenylcysteine carboxylmethyltransferase family protein [Anoxybacillus tepidamans]